MVVLALEAPRRGLFWGYVTSQPLGMHEILKKSHGTLFTWALVYNLWYHPTEGTLGFLAGFFYKFILLWQSVLLFNTNHFDKWWRVTLECLVIPHGVLIAIHQGKGYWPMFAFGFSSVFVITQMHGLNLNKGIILAIAIVWVIALVSTYVALNRLVEIHEILRIPVLDYVVVFLIVLGFWLYTRIRGCC